MATVTVLSGPERRRRWTASEKARIVEESLAAGARVAAVAQRHDVHPTLLHHLRRQARRAAGHGGQGMCRLAQRLERGRFTWPRTDGEAVSITPAQLGYLLEGIDWRFPQRSWRPQMAG